jgi:CBS domain-containing protein
MQAFRPAPRVTHPILRLTVVSEVGAQPARSRVFCRLRRESVPVEQCATCPRLEAIHDGHGDAAGWIDCRFHEHELDRFDPAGELTEIGTLLRAGATTVVEAIVTLPVALRVLEAEHCAALPVVDEGAHLVGIVHERHLLRRAAEPPSPEGHERRATTVASAMSSAAPVAERMSVRSALRFMAAHHLREVVVVSPEGRPLGIVRDVDGLRWIARAKSGSAADPSACIPT